jgi:hypothetical protein
VTWFLPLLLAIPCFSSPQQNSPDLDMVLERATGYVAQYEADLGNLIGSENYVQNGVWLDNGTPARVSRRMQRRILSDFLIIQVGPEWTALRKVNQVDGSKVKEVEASFEDAFDNSPAANAKRLEAMRRESTEYNIGEIRRDINLPTFALKVLRRSEFSRFSFERAGSGKIQGISAWMVRFHERSGRSLVAGINGETLYSTGTLWIEPETGRVLQTEFEVENPHTPSRLKGRTVVTYAPGKKIEMLVPNQMVEHYESQYLTIDCRADYSNFRPFEVDVKFEIASPQP